MSECLLKAAHAPQEIYTVRVCAGATVDDLLHMLERVTPYKRENMMLVKNGKVLASYMKASAALPVAFLVEELEQPELPNNLGQPCSYGRKIRSHVRYRGLTCSQYACY